MDFYNTINLEGEVLRECVNRASKQAEAVYAIFAYNPESTFTPFDIQDKLRIFDTKYWNVPVTSIRRAMTNLTKAGLIKKLNRYKPGRYGKRNFLWQLNEK